MVEGGARTGVPVVQRPSPPRKVSVHAVGAVDGVKHDHKDGEDGVVGGGLETDAVRANVKVAVVSEEAEGRGSEGAAGAGDSTSQRRLEHVEGEGGGKVGGALEAKEAKLSLGHAAPEGGRPPVVLSRLFGSAPRGKPSRCHDLSTQTDHGLSKPCVTTVTEQFTRSNCSELLRRARKEPTRFFFRAPSSDADGQAAEARPWV